MAVQNANIRKVRYAGTQSAEDLYRCVETGRVYARQICDKQHVRWLTTSRWSGGYEPSMPIKAGLVMQIVDNACTPLFDETIFRKDGYSDPVAEKKAPFWREAVKEQAKNLAENMNLSDHKQWWAWLMAEADALGYKGEPDNWLYCDTVSGDKAKTIGHVQILGESLCITSQTVLHTACGKSWEIIEIRYAGLNQIEEICGYRM